MKKFFMTITLLVLVLGLTACQKELPPFPDVPVGEATTTFETGVVLNPDDIYVTESGGLSFSATPGEGIWAVYRKIYADAEYTSRKVSNDFSGISNDWTVIWDTDPAVSGTIPNSNLRDATGNLQVGDYNIVVMAYRLNEDTGEWDSETLYYFTKSLHVAGVCTEGSYQCSGDDRQLCSGNVWTTSESNYAVCTGDASRSYCDDGDLLTEDCGLICTDGACVGGAPDLPVPPAGCLSDADCPGEQCWDTGECVPNTWQCDSDSDCGTMEECTNHICTETDLGGPDT